MPRPDGIPGAEGLPLWDTVEALYFLVAGFTAGAVAGFLFPSLWRAFRRRFRNTARYQASGRLSPELQAPHVVLPHDSAFEGEEERRAAGLESLFVLARDLVHTGRAREAVQVYLDILGSERVSKQATNRALFELSQTYASLGLVGRAFDTAFELLNRKPTLTPVFEHLLALTIRMGRWERLDALLRTWKGETDARLRLRVAHVLCMQGESHLVADRLDLARDVAMRAARWDLECGRARILLWAATSREMWRKCNGDLRMKWSAVAADLEARVRIQAETRVAPAAGAEMLRALLGEVASEEGQQAFLAVAPEVAVILAVRDASGERLLHEILLYACFLGVRSAAEGRRALEMARRLAPSFPEFPALTGDDVLAIFSRGLLMHRCRSCGNLAAGFTWDCPACGMPEGLWPETRLWSADHPANLSSERA